MSIFETIKEIAKVVQQADNVDLNRKLIEVSAQAVELQAENNRLENENRFLKSKINHEQLIVRHDDPYLTLKAHPETERYCATCWGRDEKLIQVTRLYNGHFKCPACGTIGVYDRTMADKVLGKERSGFDWGDEHD